MLGAIPIRPLVAGLGALLVVSAVRVAAQDFTGLAQGSRGVAPVEYRLLMDSAAALQTRQHWPAAAALYQRLVGAYPYDARVWNSLGFTHRQAGEHLAAAQAYARAARLGTPIIGRSASGHAAREYARAGQADSALTWLERAITDHKIEAPLVWLGDTAFVALRRDERYRRLVGPSAEGLDRIAGWGLDIDYLLSQHRRLNEAADPVPSTITRAAEALKTRVGALTDLQVALELQRLVAQMGRSHNGFDLLGFPASWGVGSSPLNAYLFEADVYVIRADSMHRDLLGAKIVAVEGRPMVEIFEVLASLLPAEGEPLRDFVPHAVVNPALLHALRLTPRPDRMTLTVVDRTGRTRTAEVAAGRGIGWFDNLPPSPLTARPAPLYTRDAPAAHWFEHLPEQGAVYVRIKNIYNNPGAEPMAEFAQRLRRFLEERPDVTSLIVDLRRNSGGNTYLYQELLRTVIAFDVRQGHRTFAIIDRRVYSAGMNLAIDLSRLTNAVFVGEATGASVEQHGDAAALRLPYSGLSFRVSTTIWNLSSPHDDRRWIAPDVPVSLTAVDYFENRDPMLEAVYELIRR